jgi:hypothetical protein
VLDTPQSTAALEWVTGSQGYMDIHVDLAAPAAQSLFFVDVDVNLYCLYYSSNENVLGAGAWAGLRRLSDTDLITLPEYEPNSNRAPLSVDSQIRVSNILLCGAA